MSDVTRRPCRDGPTAGLSTPKMDFLRIRWSVGVEVSTTVAIPVSKRPCRPLPSPQGLTKLKLPWTLFESVPPLACREVQAPWLSSAPEPMSLEIVIKSRGISSGEV